MNEFKADWKKAPEWATKFGKKLVINESYMPVWYNDKKACSGADTPNAVALQAITFKPVDVIFIENRFEK